MSNVDKAKDNGTTQMVVFDESLPTNWKKRFVPSFIMTLEEIQKHNSNKRRRVSVHHTVHEDKQGLKNTQKQE